MAITNKGQGWERRHSLWIGWALLSVGLLSWIAFFWIAYRARHSRWYLWGLIYSIPFIALMASDAVNLPSALMGLVVFGMWIASSIHAFLIRKEYLLRLEAIQALRSQEEAELRQRIAVQTGLRTTPPIVPQAPTASRSTQAQGELSREVPLGWPTVDATGQPSVSPSRPSSIPLVYINRASEQMISSLPGVGPILAKKAIKARDSRGGFSSVEEFGEVLGLKPHMVERIRPLVVITPVGSTTTATAGRLVDF